MLIGVKETIAKVCTQHALHSQAPAAVGSAEVSAHGSSHIAQNLCWSAQRSKPRGATA